MGGAVEQRHGILIEDIAQHPAAVEVARVEQIRVESRAGSHSQNTASVALQYHNCAAESLDGALRLFLKILVERAVNLISRFRLTLPQPGNHAALLVNDVQRGAALTGKIFLPPGLQASHANALIHPVTPPPVFIHGLWRNGLDIANRMRSCLVEIIACVVRIHHQPIQ